MKKLITILLTLILISCNAQKLCNDCVKKSSYDSVQMLLWEQQAENDTIIIERDNYKNLYELAIQNIDSMNLGINKAYWSNNTGYYSVSVETKDILLKITQTLPDSSKNVITITAGEIFNINMFNPDGWKYSGNYLDRTKIIEQ